MENPLKDQKIIAGLVLFSIGLLLFCIPFIFDGEVMEKGSLIPLIWNGSSFWIYFFVARGRGWKFPNQNYNILLLLIGNLSAYCLNREIPVFDVSTNWLAAYLVVLNSGMLLYCFRNILPEWVEYSLPAIFCSGILFNIYEAIYVIPLYPLAIFSFWFFLISLHTFVPLLWIILLSQISIPYWSKGRPFLYSVVIGCAIPVAMTIGFSTKWHFINNQLKEAYNPSNRTKNRELPPWVELSKVLSNDWQTQKILKSGLVYSIADISDFGFAPNNLSRNERKKHDPFVVVASFFSKPLKLKAKEQIQLLNAVFNQRHQTERKLWSGKDLITKNVETTIEFFPEYRMSYTEKIITIANNSNKKFRGRQQEALYSFYLPEGAVVTSASLWVEGKERPSFLTTRNKADSAYTTIVGRERRDPLVIHWQEGNRVTVRVFPVTPQEDRQFKIGITSPLQEKNGQLIYENPDFEGPYWENTTEKIRILGAAKKLSFLSKLAFKSDGSEWKYDGKYCSDWTLKLDAPELINTTFSFNHQHFQLSPYYPETVPFEASEIYLDINKSWSKREFNTLWEQIKYQPVYVYTHEIVRLNPNNKNRLFKQLKNHHFSLFPFYKIIHPETALVITRTENLTPVLDDLKGSIFSKKLNGFLLKNEQPVSVFDLGGRPSLYIKSLKELRSIHHHIGDMKELLSFLEKKIFIKHIENDSLISLPKMGINIQKVTDNLNQTSAPDHLMRIFIYNDLMKKIGRNYFKKEKLEAELVAEAEAGFVVSPVSSLIVLETQKDYDRFDIKGSKNSLKNASINNAGSVPEPEEWLLIILSLAVASFFWWKLKI